MTLIYINSSATERPFAGLAFSYFFNETFEDGLRDTLGVTATTGVVVLGPGPQTGSVDADDGVSGGFGIRRERPLAEPCACRGLVAAVGARRLGAAPEKPLNMPA